MLLGEALAARVAASAGRLAPLVARLVDADDADPAAIVAGLSYVEADAALGLAGVLIGVEIAARRGESVELGKRIAAVLDRLGRDAAAARVREKIKEMTDA